MRYDFDQEIDRKGSNAVKWEFIQGAEDLLHWEQTDACFGEDRLLPLWVADMDFRSPEPVVEALVDRAKHGIYGYAAPTEEYYASVVDWMMRRHEWKIDADWICTSPGVVPALNMLVRTFVSPGDQVIIQPPVYYPFFSAVENNSAELITNPLVYRDGCYRMDFADLEAKAKNPRAKMIILCSPHNPVGRVWTAEELIRFGEICLENEVLVVSDEIHADLMLRGNRFTPYATLSEEFAARSIICTAPSKTFNLAGLQTSNVIIPDERLRSAFCETLLTNGLFGMSVFGVVAVQAAYEHGEPWLEQLLRYLEGNLTYLESYLGKHMPQIKLIEPEGTYLVWLDCRDLGLDHLELKRLMMEGARVYLDEGHIFGAEGEGFERINIACPRSILEEALQRIRHAVAAVTN